METKNTHIALLPVKLPKKNKPVKAIIKHYCKWIIEVVDLVAVDEDDCNWRFLTDNCELAYEWNVVYWEYL